MADTRPDAGIPLILSGPPRSGTTLFSALLDGHPDINWMIDEGYFFEHLHVLGADNGERFVRAAMLGVEELIEGLRERNIMPPTHAAPIDFPALAFAWSEERFRAVLAGRRATTPQELWALLRDAYFAGFGYEPRRYVSMKAADCGRSVFGALECFAEARGIVIVREPVAALNSLKAYRRKRGTKLLSWPALAEAVAAMNRMASLVDRFGPDRLQVLRYEDVVSASECTMRGVCGWLGIAFDPILLRPSMMGQPWTNNSSFGEGEAGSAPMPGDRQTLLSGHERDYILWALEPFRSRFGYG